MIKSIILSTIVELEKLLPNDIELGTNVRKFLYNIEKQKYYRKEYTDEYITKLKENEIFIFGSNSLGEHRGGSAKTAFENFGAIWGQAKGLQGSSYGIVTIDLPSELNVKNKISLGNITLQIIELYKFANENKHLTFYMTKIGTLRAGFTTENISAIFSILGEVPKNIVLPKEFVNLSK